MTLQQKQADYIQYVEAKIEIAELPLTFEQWDEFNEMCADDEDAYEPCEMDDESDC
jgi:hypothetical protein